MIEREKMIKQLKNNLSSDKKQASKKQSTQRSSSKPPQSQNTSHPTKQVNDTKPKPTNANREMTEEEKNEMIKMIQMNASVGYLISEKLTSAPIFLKKQQTQQNNDEYDPLDPGIGRKQDTSQFLQSSFRQNIETQSMKDLNKVLVEKARKEMGVTETIEDIERKVKEQQDIERREKARREREEEERRKLRQKEREAKGMKQRDIENSDKHAEIQRLKMKLSEKSKHKHRDVKTKDYAKSSHDTKQELVFCRQCQKKHAADYHSKSKIKMGMDPESKEMKPTVNVIDIKSSQKHQKTKNIIIQRDQKSEYVPVTKSKPIETKPERPQLNILKNNLLGKRKPDDRHKLSGEKHRQSKHPKQSSSSSSSEEDEEDQDKDLSDFIVDDEEDEDDYNHHRRHHSRQDDYRQELSSILKRFGPTRKYLSDSDGSSDSMMEADYDTIENEERLAAKIARREDAEELKRIEEDERMERMERKMKKRDAKRRLKRNLDSD